MLNVNQITSTLAKLSDQALQQYAALHKEDPYIMSLAVAESNRRKELRGAVQGAQGQMEQPKVADRALAEMAPPQQALPEEQGIARLPAGEMNFADGGIVAFAGGGTPEDAIPFQANNNFGGVSAIPYYLPGPSEERDRMNALPGQLLGRGLDALGRGWDWATKGSALEVERKRKEAERLGALRNMKAPPEETVGTPEFVAAQAKAAAASGNAPAAAGDTSPRTNSPGEAAAASARQESSRSASAASRTPAAAAIDVPGMLNSALDAAAKKDNPFAPQIEELGKERVKSKEEYVSGLEAIQKKFDDIYKGRRERLDAKEGEIGKMKDQQVGLAFLQAGAAMMSTPGGIGTALGKGVKVGTEQYASGLEKLQAAKDKLSDARDRLEDLEAQRGELSAREMFKARNDVRDTSIAAKDDLIKANMQMYGVNRETAVKMVDMQVRAAISQADNASRERVAGIQAAAMAARSDAGQNQRLAQLAENTRKNIQAEALKAFPYNATQREAYVQQKLAEALQINPDLAQYVGAPGGGRAPAAGKPDFRLNPATGQVEPVR